jgi:GDPmannose 4,6-dehydratase
MKLKKNRKILIVGYGQDAKVFTSQIDQNSKKIHVITNTKNKTTNKNILLKFVSIENRSAVFNYLKKFKNLDIYFFATHNISSSQNENSLLSIKNLETNVISLTNFLEFMFLNKKKNNKLFYACSSHIFENSLSKKQNELTKPSFQSQYALSKYLGLEICHYYKNIKNVFCSVGILYTHVSKYVNNNFLIKELSTKLKKSTNNIIYVNNINSELDLMSADDAVLAMRKIMNLNKPDTFIISSGKKVTIKNLFKEILNYQNIETKYQIKSKKYSMKKNSKLFGDNSKLKKKTNWTIKDNLKQTVRKVLN